MRLALRLVLPSVLAVILHAIPSLAFPLSSASASENNPTTDAISRIPPPSNVTSIDVNSFRKHVYRVQGTNAVLTISLGKRIEGIELASFLDLTRDFVTSQAVRHGYNTLLPMGTFEYSLGEELGVFAESSLALVYQMTWGILKDSIKGLQGFLVGLRNFREAECRVNMADPAGSFVGYVDLKIRKAPSKLHLARDVLTLPTENHDSKFTARLSVDENVHIDIRPSWRRVDLVAVKMLLVVVEDWAAEAVERTHPDQPLREGGLQKSLGDGVVLKMQRAPGKALTYGLVLETVKRLLDWELRTGKGKVVEFGILQHGFIKGSGSIKQEKYRSLEAAT